MATCGICLETLGANQCNITTKCDHSYHNKCLTHWLINKNTCPLCRCKLYEKSIEEDSDVESDEENDETEYIIRLNNSIITLDDNAVTKITQRIQELTEHINSNYQLPLKNKWHVYYYIDILNQMEFLTYVNTKKYKCKTKFEVYTHHNQIYIDICSITTYKCHDRQIRMRRYGYQKWRTRNINHQTSVSCF